MNTVKTYRVVRGELLVGHSIRRADDFLPEASEWPSLRAHLRTGAIEIVYVDSKVLDAFKKKVATAEALAEAKVDVVAAAPHPTKKRIIRKRVEVNAGLNEESV